MKILLLGPQRPTLANFISSFGDAIVSTEKPLFGDSKILNGIEFIISYGYRYILKKDIIDKFHKRAINLHISFLPWNKGADPNLWSFLEDSPKGVTIHYLDYGIDTGDILAQKEVGFTLEDTLRTTYERLSTTIEELFKQAWPHIRAGTLKPTPQPLGGSYHRLGDRTAYEHLLTKGWDTNVAGLIGKALERPFN